LHKIEVDIVLYS